MKISKIFIDKSVANHPGTVRLLKHFRTVPETIDAIEVAYEYVRNAADPIGTGKRTLLVTANRGSFIRSCPGTRSYLCCGYQILHIGTYCSMDCSYCILQAYFHPPLLQYFVNIDDLMGELNSWLAKTPVARIGTGEFTDSLIWEPWTALSQQLITRFSKQTRAVLELKTKTMAIDNLLDRDHHNKTILAWSLNTPRIIATEERNTASLNARLQAATKAQQCGYPLAFHFDPLVLYDGCESEYEGVIDSLFNHIRPEQVVWISMGGFRFMPALKEIIACRYPHSTIIYGEFISGLDTKMRYFKPLRIALYKQLIAKIREHAPQATIYFCMEDEVVWREAMGFSPAEKGGLSAMLDANARKICGLE